MIFVKILQKKRVSKDRTDVIKGSENLSSLSSTSTIQGTNIDVGKKILTPPKDEQGAKKNKMKGK